MDMVNFGTIHIEYGTQGNFQKEKSMDLEHLSCQVVTHILVNFKTMCRKDMEYFIMRMEDTTGDNFKKAFDMAKE